VLIMLGVALALASAPTEQNSSTAPATQSSTQPVNALKPTGDDLEPSIKVELEKIDERAAGIKDLRADFHQRKHTALLKKPMESQGEVRIDASPDHSVIRWDTTRPSAITTWINTEELRIYSPKESLLEIYPIDAGWGQLTASPLPRLNSLRKQFVIRPWIWQDAQTEAQTNVNMPLALQLIPREQRIAEHLEEVRILIDRALGCVVAAEVIYPEDDRLEIRFSKIRINSGIEASELELDVPQGTTISRPLSAKDSEE
jgi:outer membrane lipoprotein-sorting protein